MAELRFGASLPASLYNTATQAPFSWYALHSEPQPPPTHQSLATDHGVDEAPKGED